MFKKYKEKKAAEEMLRFIEANKRTEEKELAKIKKNLPVFKQQKKDLLECIELAKNYKKREKMGGPKPSEEIVFMLKETWRMSLQSMYLAKDYIYMAYCLIMSYFLDGKERECEKYNTVKFESSLFPDVEIKDIKETIKDAISKSWKREPVYYSNNPEDLKKLHQFWVNTVEKAEKEYWEVFNEVMRVKNESDIDIDFLEEEVKTLSIMPK